MSRKSIPRDVMSKHEDYIKSLPLNQKSSITQYINGSSHLNHLLREGFNVKNPEHCKYYGPEMTQRVHNMDNALLSEHLERINRGSRNFVVYRGINSPTLGQALERMGYLHHPHYMSTSRLATVATNAFAGDGCCVFKIEVDPSSPTCPAFLFVSHESSSESEVLFQRDTYLNYLGKEVMQGKTTYRVSVSTQPVPFKSRSPSPGTPRCSTPGQIIVPITRSDVEDELSFLSDEQMKDDQSIIGAIAKSLHATFVNTPFQSLRDAVEHLYEEIKRGSMEGGRRRRRAPHSVTHT